MGDPISPSRYPYRLDDQKLMYPAYQKMVEAGITTFCIHKGLVPDDPAEYPAWQHAKVDDVGQAARDWPQINFVIYHAALQPITDYPQAHLERFEKSGRINWVSDLAEIPARYGVSNVYAEIGTAFASSCLSHPRHAAALLGILIKGMGPDKVLWGTDSVWYGSPQWQIEALRRIEIPADLRQRYGFAPLGGPDSAVKRAILGRNAASLYGLQLPAKGKHPIWHNDRLAGLKDAYQKDPAIAKAAVLEADRKRRGSRP